MADNPKIRQILIPEGNESVLYDIEASSVAAGAMSAYDLKEATEANNLNEDGSIKETVLCLIFDCGDAFNLV